MYFFWCLPHSCLAVSCGNPGTPINGDMTGDNFTFTHSVIFTCARGYVMTGANHLSCQADGRWNGSLPACPPVCCPELAAPAWSNLNGSDHHYGGQVDFTCMDGFDLVGLPTLVCQWTGQWSAVLPHCKAITCSELTIPQHMAVMSVNATYGGSAVLSCVHGYTAADNTTASWNLTCLSSGQWSNSSAACLGKAYIM